MKWKYEKRWPIQERGFVEIDVAGAVEMTLEHTNADGEMERMRERFDNIREMLKRMAPHMTEACQRDMVSHWRLEEMD